MKNSIKPYLSNMKRKNQLKLFNSSFPQNSSFDKIRQNLVSFNIFFYDLNYDFINGQPQQDWFSLLANMAGICGGSFLGMSLLAILEFFELFFISSLHIIRFAFSNAIDKIKFLFNKK